MTPALIFGLGVTPVVAVGTDLIFAGLTKSIGVYAHRVAGNVDWPAMRLLAYGSIPATMISIVILNPSFVARWLERSSPAGSWGRPVADCAGCSFAGSHGGNCRATSRRSGLIGPGWIVFSGALLGCLVTLSSVGAGALGVAVLMIGRPSMEAKRIVGTNLAHALPLALIAGAGHWTLGTVDFRLLGALLIGSLPGIYLGSSLTGRVPEPVLRAALASVLCGCRFDVHF